MQNNFNNYYLSGIHSTAIKVSIVDQSKFILVSYYKDCTNSQQGLDLKHIDFNGNSLARKRYKFQSVDFGNMLYNPDIFGDISSSTAMVTAGGYSNSASTVIYASINKNTLDTNWVKYFNDGVYNYFLNSVIKVKPNEVWLFGSRGNVVTKPFTLKIDTLGNLLSIKEFTSLTSYFPQACYYDQSQGLLYLTGRNTTNQNSFKTFVACIDTSGYVIWNIDFPNSPFRPIYTKIEKKNNYLVLSGSQGEYLISSFEERKFNLVKMNALNGAVIWNKKYFTRFFTNHLENFYINNDESIVAIGSGGLNNGVLSYNNDGIIFKVNSAGDSLWMQSFGNYGQGIFEGFYHIGKSPDNGYIACGYVTDPANNQSWVVKTDSLGNGPGRTTAIYEKAMEDHSVYVYPNPANKHVTIEFSSFTNHTKPKEIQLVDVLGREVKTILIESKTQKINIEDLPNGVYYLQLQTPSGLKITKKLVKE